MKKTILGALIALSLSSTVFASTYTWKEPKLDFESDRQIALTYINNASEKAGGLERMLEDSDSLNSEAKFNAAQMYIHGINFDKDIDKGIDLLKSSADLGFPLAELQYGKLLMGLYPSVSEDEVERNDREGLKYIKKAAINELGEAQHILGSHYAVGELVPEDRDLAMFWLAKSSNNSYALAFEVRKQFTKERRKNKSSFEYVQSRAIGGNVEYVVMLSDFYLEGWVVQRDRTKAVRLLKSAASLGSQTAKDKLDELGVVK
ncbi:SEL1-like repeat protein [Psychromonas sp. SP041]|uniref:tetratricopeptide repeat protein n=1 Tax=Psychromonas sp. SP041 TaxID=1365007 RepID=UPI001485A4A8|nr:SEL1-like repeat protein [Psychromonas sp. SP041]